MAADCRRYGNPRCCRIRNKYGGVDAAATAYTHLRCFYAPFSAFTPLPMAADCRRYENPRCCHSKQTSFVYATNMAVLRPPLRRIRIFVAIIRDFPPFRLSPWRQIAAATRMLLPQNGLPSYTQQIGRRGRRRYGVYTSSLLLCAAFCVYASPHGGRLPPLRTYALPCLRPARLLSPSPLTFSLPAHRILSAEHFSEYCSAGGLP